MKQLVAALALASTLALVGTAHGGIILQVDVELRGTTDLAPGFDRITMDDGGFPNTVKTFANGITVDIDPVGVVWGNNDRHRLTPTGFPEAALYRDFVFGPGNDSPAGGIDITLSGLVPNAPFFLTLWSFDQGSANNRVSDWFVVDGRGTVQVMENYTFNGSVLPTSGEDNRFTFYTLSDPTGQIVIQGRGDLSSYNNNPSVFLNALSVWAIPEPCTMALLGLGLAALARRRRRRR